MICMFRPIDCSDYRFESINFLLVLPASSSTSTNCCFSNATFIVADAYFFHNREMGSNLDGLLPKPYSCVSAVF